MIFFSSYWGQEYFMNLKKSLLLEQLLLLGVPYLRQPLCGHQCNVTFVIFCSISSAIILLWPLSPREQYVFLSKLWENVDHLLQAAFHQKCMSVGKHLAGSCHYEGWSLLLLCFFWYKKQRTHNYQWFQRRLSDESLHIFQAFNQVVFSHP